LINWFGLWLPAGASSAIQKKLHAETVKALTAAEVEKQFDLQGLEAVGSTPAQFAQFVARQSAFMNDLARRIERGGK
jgi:tripartite-type tricarboxylate transporter receptor subunit TctC